MKKYQISGVNVGIENPQEMLLERGKPYENIFLGSPDIYINISEEAINKRMAEYPQMDYNQWDYMLSGAAFYTKLLDFEGMMLHASAVVVDDGAYLFSAPSGTGKSTHTGLWLERFGDRAYILNDDKPAIRLENNVFYAYGTPFSGKFDISEPIGVPIRGISFIERAKENRITRLDTANAIAKIFEQTVRDLEGYNMDKLISLLDKLITTVPIYKLECNISDEAVVISYNAMKNSD